ncbi:BQ5605_C001g00397 [Microbotryum silenes-dioicae]|uniref:BQ5605_C001g00397 protein n=1 Tax=Microbotryum silenes-dioicae TaxID=796604 RepID=A0A2X0M7E2_9BASI|nr:BQ5605_C001g00397 [Microbotryum silenes-dioicae]
MAASPPSPGLKAVHSNSTVVDERLDQISTGDYDDAIVRAEGEERTTMFLWHLVIMAAWGGLLFGYDTGVIGGSLVHKDLARDLGRVPLRNLDKEVLTAATTLGALIASLGAGVLADRAGRKLVIFLADMFFLVGAIMQAVAFGSGAYWIAAVGRLILGFGVGSAALIVPLYISELAPTCQRGRLVTLNVIAITGGQVLAYIINIAFRNVSHGWRFMVGGGAIPPLVQLAFLPFLPETPRYMLRHGKFEETRAVLRKIYPFATEDQIMLKSKVIGVRVQKEVGEGGLLASWKKLHFVPANFRGLVIACGLQGIQQLCGFNTLMYFSPTLFQSVGFSDPLVIGLVIALTNLLFTFVALIIVDKVGRRRIACWTIPGMSLALILAAVAFHFLTLRTDGRLTDNGLLDQKWSPVVLAAMIIYVAFYATGIGNIPWQQQELFHVSVRGIGTSISTACNWAGNLIISLTFLSLINAITPSGAFGLYAGICFLGALFCIFLYPETALLSLEETLEVFSDGFGVKKAKHMRRHKKEAMRQLRAGDGQIKQVA